MTRDKNTSLTYLVFASLFSLVIAYVFGNEGHEALITIAIALGLLITWQLLNLAKLLFRSKLGLIVKILGLLPIGFFWFISIAATMLSIAMSAFDHSATAPPINWIVVLIGTLPFLIPRVNEHPSDAGTRKVITGIIVSLYSIAVLNIAIIGYYGNDARYRSLILVLAVQLQYLMSYVVTRTNYLDRSHTFATNLTRRLKISNNSMGLSLVALIVGLPFILPLATVFFAAGWF